MLDDIPEINEKNDDTITNTELNDSSEENLKDKDNLKSIDIDIPFVK